MDARARGGIPEPAADVAGDRLVHHPLLAHPRDEHLRRHLAFAEAGDLDRLGQVGSGVLDRMLEVVTRYLDREANLVFGKPLDRRVHAGHSTRTPFRDPRSTCGMLAQVQRALERLSTLADVFRNPQLRRLELSWAGFYLGEWTYFVALSVYAFDVGGAAAVGALGLVRMVPAAIALPFGGMLADRYPRQRVYSGFTSRARCSWSLWQAHWRQRAPARSSSPSRD